MNDPMFSVEAIDAAVDFQQKYNEAMQDDASFYITELDNANKKIEQLYEFLELTEALTNDRTTASLIRSFLTKEGLWKPLPQKD